MEKLITFAVPCYNSAEYMEHCINSLLKAGNEAEIIIVDDGSTKDNTAAIADEFQAKYPDVIKAVHQENGGHGQAVNTGIANATGKFFKVVDSDDWVDESALKTVMDTLRNFGEDCPDAIFANYVYEHVADNKQRVVSYKKVFPQNRTFTFDEIKKFPVGNFIAMHSVIYRTGLIKDCGLTLPKHTFYVDNIYVYKPLPSVKKFYYVNVDFYRYFIGRDDQSVAESVLMKRIDQHIRVTEELIKAHNLNDIEKQCKKLYKYMLDFILIMMVITSVYLIKIGTEESFAKKNALWEFLKQTDEITYKKCRKRFTGITASNSKFLCGVSKTVYVIARKVFKFN